MRVVKELIREEIRISIFSWNNKYILKFEFGPMEQTFKLNEMDVLEEADLESFLEGDFFKQIVERFHEMGKSFRAQLENL
ncbi:MAG TPA: hypothetical protein DEQ87_17240 [Algoriphagus sp.]|jgi:hypothetical protein|uniref:Uncharacterized protein n=1 Tax=Algoriphagus ornithinivorans TaxID=226506 RepID=A0A1I5CDW2_9BACT|nr:MULTISPECIES: hypothetical protein [Algoriphagus]MAL11852.1 hypothetical protein [Algoriphagus sp.]MAN86560.1 hypothetical protein [Algoriphagus sp.]QYH38726.1 hypothetical protein GYM62_07905 [Algoriphagus sp. NBT04N3]SFN85074.1 hypothetical protein SAMN04488519_102240 [Algoriphagus ornithinivorans]HAD52206.1 hypothetical protein [Algoriphagus sp.]|tara:strand:- start:39 stop:278 length:240 start_codon:yes stop_codon:yes gene_type:complete